MKKTAMTRIAPRSSTTASVSRNARIADGRWVLRMARTASANAMSVAIGTAQPDREPPPAEATATYRAAGTAIPHTAATTGSAAAAGVRSSPATSSRFSSMPATRKNTVSSPSAAQCPTERSRPSAPITKCASRTET